MGWNLPVISDFKFMKTLRSLRLCVFALQAAFVEMIETQRILPTLPRAEVG